MDIGNKGAQVFGGQLAPGRHLVVDGAAVSDIRNDVPVDEAIHYIAIGIEFDERWRLLRKLCFFIRHVVPINDENVSQPDHRVWRRSVQGPPSA